MYRLIVFDLDGTLCPIGKGMRSEDIALLRRLEESGARIAICSGKPTYYLCGFMRQIGLKAPVLVGENGAVIQFGVDLPPRQFYILPYSKAAKRSIRLLRDAIDQELPDMWYQPNETMLTPFPRDEKEFAALDACVDRMRPQLEDVIIYRHCDCYDITPNGLTKQSGLVRLGELLDIPAEETVCVGDGINDYPMFEYAGLALGVNVAQADKVDRNFAAISDVLHELLALQGNA